MMNDELGFVLLKVARKPFLRYSSILKQRLNRRANLDRKG